MDIQTSLPTFPPCHLLQQLAQLPLGPHWPVTCLAAALVLTPSPSTGFEAHPPLGGNACAQIPAYGHTSPSTQPRILQVETPHKQAHRAPAVSTTVRTAESPAGLHGRQPRRCFSQRTPCCCPPLVCLQSGISCLLGHKLKELISVPGHAHTNPPSPALRSPSTMTPAGLCRNCCLIRSACSQLGCVPSSPCRTLRLPP